MIFQVIVYAVIIILLVCITSFVIALADMRGSKDDVEAFLAEKRKCKFEAYDEIVAKCYKKCSGGEVSYFSYADMEEIVKELVQE